MSQLDVGQGSAVVDDTAPALAPRPHGALPAWQTGDLPAPPPFSLRNLMHVLGPGAILAATSIGGGEWLVGPAMAVRYSSSVFLIATLAIVLQVVFNLEAIRYTLYTGEPIYGGIMRMRPGPRFWAGFYIVIGFVQLGFPALAGSAAATLFAACVGRLPEGAGDAQVHAWITTGVLAAVVLLLCFGGTVERMLEYFAWIMLAVVFGFLLVVNVAFVPFDHWWHTFTGFFQFTGLPQPINWALVGALAATAGSGGLGNLTVTNWMRDKGFGMGAKVGAIPSAVGGHEVPLSPVGMVFPVTDANLARWREWLRYVHTDQLFVWGLFCFLGMYLNVNLATHVIPRGTNLEGLAAGAYQAKYLAERIWTGFWFVTLFNGFWLLFKTQLGNTDILVRTVTDMLWLTGAPARRRWSVRRIYYAILLAFTGWAVYALRSGSPMTQFKILANVAGLVLAIAGVQIFLVNRAFLPRELRPPLWREVMLLACSAFYAFFSFFVFRSLLFGR